MPMYARGTQAKALCMRCGLQFLLPELVNDGYFPNIRVCTDCYDPPQPQEKLAIVSDPEGLWKPSPDTYVVTAPLLNIQVLGLDVALNWSGFNVHGPELTAGYLVQRSPTGLAAWTTIANLGAITPGQNVQATVWAEGADATGTAQIAIAWVAVCVIERDIFTTPSFAAYSAALP